MIFPNINCDLIVQQDDKFRISAQRSYKTADEAAISKIEIEADTGLGFIDVTGDLTKPYPEKKWFLDYQHATNGTKTISVKVTVGTGLGATSATSTLDIMVVTEIADNLFATDDNLKEIQEDVYNLLPDGRATFKYKHRAAQNFILDWLWNNGYFKTTPTEGPTPYVKADVIDKEFISDWATYVCLRMIYNSASNQAADIFKTKSNEYLEYEVLAREKFLIKLDGNNDGNLDELEGAAITSRRLIRV